jgi:HEAT repeat protein
MLISKAKPAAVWALALLAAGTSGAMIGHRTASQKQQAKVAGADAADEESLKRENEKLKREFAELRDKVEATERKLLDKEAAPITYKGKPKSHWLQQLRDLDQDTQVSAIQALGIIGREDRSVIPAIVGRLKSKDGYIRSKAVQAIASLGPDGKETIPELLQLLGTETLVANPEALWKVDPEGKIVLPALVKKLKDENEHVRFEAAYIMSKHKKAEPAIPALTAATKDRDANVRGWAALALGNIGPAAKDAAPSLIALRKDDHKFSPGVTPGTASRYHGIEKVGDAAARALDQIDPDVAKKEADVK